MNHAFCIPYKVKFIYFLDKLIFLYKSSTFHLKFEKKSRSVGFVFDFWLALSYRQFVAVSKKLN